MIFSKNSSRTLISMLPIDSSYMGSNCKWLELLLFSEEHGKAYDSAVNEQPADNAHDHGFDADLLRVRKYNGKSCTRPLAIVTPFDSMTLPKVQQRTNSHNNQETRQESPKLHNAVAPRIHEIVIILRFAAYPVGHGSEDIGGHDEESEVAVEEGGGEDDEDEADGEDLRCRLVSEVTR